MSIHASYLRAELAYTKVSLMGNVGLVTSNRMCSSVVKMSCPGWFVSSRHYFLFDELFSADIRLSSVSLKATNVPHAVAYPWLK